MTGSSEQVKFVLDQYAKALELRPSIGQGAAVTRVRLGLACQIEEGTARRGVPIRSLEIEVRADYDATFPQPGMWPLP